MPEAIRILYVEDVPTDVALVNHELRRAGLDFRARRVESKADFLHELQHNPPDIILSDHGLPSFDGFTALAIARDKCPEVPFIFVTGSLGEKVAIESFESGATDYVLKSELGRLAPAVKRALREGAERFRLRRQEQAQQESEERFRMLVEGVKDYAIFMLDPAGCVTSWNAGAQWLHGYRAEEVQGRHFSILYTTEDQARHSPEKSLKIAATEGRFEEEGRRVGRGGKEFWANVVITAVRDRNGNLRGFAQVTRDMTERKQTEAEIQLLNEGLEQRVRERTAQLEAANHELEAFNHSVAHDLRAPLRHIAGYVSVLQSEAGAKLDEKWRQSLDAIADSAARMDRLIEALLKFASMGRARMQRQRVDLARLVNEARQELQQEFQGRKIDWKVAVLPQVRGDPDMLRQVFINLFSNALKYSRTRTTAWIEIGAKETGQETIIFVRDNGVGFDMKDAPRLFGVFQRLHPGREFTGTGIGLANVRRIILRHGGRTWAEGEVGKGATFYFSLPRGRVPAQHPPGTAVAPGGLV